MLGLELLHVLQAVVDEAEPRALAATVVGPEAEERHRRRVRHTELLLPERKKYTREKREGGRKGGGVVHEETGRGKKKKRQEKEQLSMKVQRGLRAGASNHSSMTEVLKKNKKRYLVRVTL